MALKTMYDRSGRAVQVPEEQAAAAYKSGDLTFAEGDTLHLSRGGKVVELNAADAVATLGGAEGRYYDTATGEQYQEQQLAEEYGGWGKQAKAAAAGAARGLTLGLSDVAISELGGDDARAELQQLQQRAAGASLAGEIGGGLVGALASGGTGLAARGASAATRASAAVGGLAERAAARGALGLGLREGGAAARALSTAAGWGAEGALQAAGSEVSRAAIANEALDGERLAAAGLHGATAGALLGGAGSAVASAGKAVASRALAAGLDTATALAERMGVTARSAAQEGEALQAKVARLIDTLAPGGTEAAAARATVKSTGGNKEQLRQILDASDPVQARVQGMLREEIPQALGLSPGGIASRQQMAEAVPGLVKVEGDKMRAALGQIDAAAAGRGPDVRALARRADDEIVSKLASDPFMERRAAAVQQRVDMLRDLGDYRLGFSGLHDFAQGLRREIGAMPAGLERRGLERFGEMIEREIEQAGARVAEQAGEKAAAAAYREALTGQRAAQLVGDALREGAKVDAKAAGLSMGDQLALVSSAVQGGPVGAASAAAHLYASRLASRYGQQAAASVLRDVAAGATLPQAVGRVVDQVVGESVKGFFRKAGGAVERGVEAGASAARVQVRRQATTLVDEQAERRAFDRELERVTSAPSGGPSGAQGAEAAAEATAERGRQFLLSKAPKSPGGGLQPHLNKTRPPLEAQRKFLAYTRAVDDPVSVLRDLERGRLSPEGLEALRTVYPELYGQIRQEAARQLVDQRQQLRGPEARALGALLGVDDPDPTTARRLVSAVQGAYQAAGSGAGGTGSGGPPAPPRRPVNTARLYDDDAADAA